MNSIHSIWKKSDLSFVAASSHLTAEELAELKQDPEAVALMHSTQLTIFFGHFWSKNETLICSHPGMTKVLQSLGVSTSPNSIPTVDIESWITKKSKFVSTFEREFRNRYPLDFSLTKGRLHRASNKIHENLVLMENLISKENIHFEEVSVEDRNQAFELDEEVFNLAK